MEILQPIDTYQTDVKKRIQYFRTIRFYKKIIKIVFSAASLAKKGIYNDEEWIKSSVDVLNALESVGCIFDIRGRNNFFNIQGPCVFIGNHMSTLETFVLPCVIHPFKKITFIVKESLLNYPVFKHVMRARKPIAVTRTNPREDFRRVIKEGTSKLKNNISIVVFPQTTRANHFDEKEFNSIGIKLAKKANVPVVPIALKTDAWGTGRLVKDFGPIDPQKTVYFKFGLPISAQEVQKNPKTAHQQVVNFIKKQLNNWITLEQNKKC